jgi:hypothetical protein
MWTGQGQDTTLLAPRGAWSSRRGQRRNDRPQALFPDVAEALWRLAIPDPAWVVERELADQTPALEMRKVPGSPS